MLKPKKSLGQNFLRDKNIILKIVSSLQSPADSKVFEIGPGDGALTAHLLDKYPALQVIEIDSRAVELLQEKFPKLSVIQQDIRKTDWHDLILANEKAAVIGNLPYYITSQILFSVLDNGHLFSEAVFMMQKEVAERVVAKHGNKTYGILSVQSQILSECEILFNVSPNVFEPKPKVDSAVVRFVPKELEKDFKVDVFKTIVRTAFNQRRKKLSNALKGLSGMENMPEDFANKRAEALRPEDYVLLTKWYQNECLHT